MGGDLGDLAWSAAAADWEICWKRVMDWEMNWWRERGREEEEEEGLRLWIRVLREGFADLNPNFVADERNSSAEVWSDERSLFSIFNRSDDLLDQTQRYTVCTYVYTCVRYG